AVSGFALRNFADLSMTFSELGRIVRSGGRISLLDVSEPSSALLKAGHRIWFTGVVPRIGALLSDGAAYSYLPRSVAYLPSFEEMKAMLASAGFVGVARTALSGGIVQVITGSRS
ncbi:MAG: class I SAM-dependent methyltransferase, partial [Acidimicrobiales bacterium]